MYSIIVIMRTARFHIKKLYILAMGCNYVIGLAVKSFVIQGDPQKPDIFKINSKKGKAIPLQAWTGPEGSRRLRFPDFKTIGT